MNNPSEGLGHLVWIERFQVVLLVLGGPLWLLRSWRAAIAFLVGGAISLLFWRLHRFLVSGMLTPSVKRRWLYAILSIVKLALIALGLRAMMACFSTEAIPLATGVLLFVGGIIMEAGRLVFWPDVGNGG
jgi:hypothetical protein